MKRPGIKLLSPFNGHSDISDYSFKTEKEYPYGDNYNGGSKFDIERYNSSSISKVNKAFHKLNKKDINQHGFDFARAIFGQ